MKLKANLDVPAFLKAVQTCAGEVNFITAEGDNLNMKSTLSRFIFTAVIAGNLKAVEGHICVADPRDEALLRAYCEE